MYDLIIELAHTLWKNGFSLTALGTAVYVLLKQRAVKKRLRRFIPWLLADDSETKLYVANQREIIENLKIYFAKEGLEWKTADTLKKNSLNSVTKSASGSRGQWTLNIIARFATKFTLLRRITSMKKYLKKLGSRKFQAFLAVTIPNMIIMFGFILGDIDLEGKVNEWMPAINLVIQGIVTMVYQKIEGGIDKANAANQPAADEDGSNYSH